MERRLPRKGWGRALSTILFLSVEKWVKTERVAPLVFLIPQRVWVSEARTRVNNLKAQPTFCVCESSNEALVTRPAS